MISWNFTNHSLQPKTMDFPSVHRPHNHHHPPYPDYSYYQYEQHHQYASSYYYPEPPILPPGVSDQNAYQPPQRMGGYVAMPLFTAEPATAQLHGFGPMIGGPGSGQLTKSGSVQYGPGPLRSPASESPYARMHKKVGGLFRGGGRRSSGKNPPREGGSRGPFKASSSLAEFFVAEKAVSSGQMSEPSADDHKGATQAEATRKRNSVPYQQCQQGPWCDLCKVECTSFEILDQHKNGKRHKKNLKRLEESEAANNPVAEVENDHRRPDNEHAGRTWKPDNLPENEEHNQTLPKYLHPGAVVNESKIETEQQDVEAKQTNVAAEPTLTAQVKKPSSRIDNQRHGMKRKMRGGARGGKHAKATDASERQMESAKPKVMIPLICDLCNVRCDTQDVFDRHLSGKKHLSKLKRYQGHQALYGPIGLQALYPPNPLLQTLHPQGAQQTINGLSSPYSAPGASMPTQVHSTAPSFVGHPSKPITETAQPEGTHQSVDSQQGSYLPPGAAMPTQTHHAEPVENGNTSGG